MVVAARARFRDEAQRTVRLTLQLLQGLGLATSLLEEVSTAMKRSTSGIW